MLRKLCIRLSLSTFTSIEHFKQLTVTELAEVIDEVKEANKKK